MAGNKHATWKKFQEKMKEKRCEPRLVLKTAKNKASNLRN